MKAGGVLSCYANLGLQNKTWHIQKNVGNILTVETAGDAQSREEWHCRQGWSE